MRYITPSPPLDLSILQQEASALMEHTIIASFLGKRIPPHAIADWISLINQKLGFQGVGFRMDMGRGFFFLSTANVQVLRKVLSFTPHITPWGSCIYQEWVAGFDPDAPSGLKIPSWLSFPTSSSPSKDS
ncbi:hypothetical protein M758_UG036100 [Ceratodon purpureus]|nr:hypothetical protein M758_UG036100 [Ceratodon purpureus]